jgi:hypothetical protein
MNQDQGKENIYFCSVREKKIKIKKVQKLRICHTHRKKKVSQRFRAAKSQANKARKKPKK